MSQSKFVEFSIKRCTLYTGFAHILFHFYYMKSLSLRYRFSHFPGDVKKCKHQYSQRHTHEHSHIKLVAIIDLMFLIFYLFVCSLLCDCDHIFDSALNFRVYPISHFTCVFIYYMLYYLFTFCRCTLFFNFRSSANVYHKTRQTVESTSNQYVKIFTYTFVHTSHFRFGCSLLISWLMMLLLLSFFFSHLPFVVQTDACI